MPTVHLHLNRSDGFELQDGELHTDNNHIFDEDPERIIRLFGIHKDFPQNYPRAYALLCATVYL